MNQSIFNYFFNFAHQNLFQDQILIFLANGFSILVFISGVLYVLFHQEGKISLIEDRKTFSNRMREIFVFCATGILSWFFAILLKRIFASPRPYETLDIIPLFYNGSMDSFPSGHAAVFGALCFALIFMHRSFGVALFVLLSILALLSRIATGVHFPVDILAGLFIGFLIAYLIYVIFRPVIYKKSMVSKNTKK